MAGPVPIDLASSSSELSEDERILPSEPPPEPPAAQQQEGQGTGQRQQHRGKAKAKRKPKKRIRRAAVASSSSSSSDDASESESEEEGEDPQRGGRRRRRPQQQQVQEQQPAKPPQATKRRRGQLRGVVRSGSESDVDGGGVGDGRVEEVEEAEAVVVVVLDSSDEEAEAAAAAAAAVMVAGEEEIKGGGGGGGRAAKGAERAAAGAGAGTTSGGGKGKKRPRAAIAAAGGGAGGAGGSGILQFITKPSSSSSSSAAATRPPRAQQQQQQRRSSSSPCPSPPSSPLGGGEESSMLWTDKHAPQRSEELAVPPKKVQEVRAWLKGALGMEEEAAEDWATRGGLPPVGWQSQQSQSQSQSQRLSQHLHRGGGGKSNRLLILRGPPGVGKSALVAVLAKEMGLEVVRWAEEASLVSLASVAAGAEGGEGPWRGGVEGYVSQAADFGRFLRGAAYRPLELGGGGKGGGLPLALEVKGKKGLGKGKAAPPEGEGEKGKQRKKLFVIEELPSCQGSERAGQQLQAALVGFLAEAAHPAVLIFTEENEDHYGSFGLERLLTRAVLTAPGVKQIHVNPVTDANMRKVLGRIAAAEGVRAPGEDIERVVVSSKGDVRHAILTLQLQLALAPRSASAAAAAAKAKGGKGGKGKGSKKGGMGGGGPSVVAASLGAGGREDKDRYLSGLHAIGKIIYAKRDPAPLLSPLSPPASSQQPPTLPLPQRGKLSFVPEEVLSRSDMEPDALGAFIQTHCIPHFGRLGPDLVDCLAYFSDADLLQARRYSSAFHRDQTDPLFPDEYALSLLGRAVPECNRHPVKPTGVAGKVGGTGGFTAPRLYECLRLRREGTRRLGLLCNDYLLATRAEGAAPARLTATEMITELVPYAKLIGQHQQPPQRPHGTSATPIPGAHRPDNDDEEDEARAASLASALGFLRLFNRRCSGPPERAVVAAGVGGVGGEGDDGGSGGGPTDLDVDDIVEED